MVLDDKKDIDVIIPVYNGEKFIIETLNSVISQTHKPQNIIVVDDGSTDKTEEFTKKIQKTTTIPIIYIKQSNQGPSVARNTGLKISKTNFVAFLDSDDIWWKTKLEKQIKIFSRDYNKDLAVVYCLCDTISENGLPMTEIVSFKKYHRGHIFKDLLYGNLIMGSASTVLIRRECLDKVGYFDESLKVGEDWDLWLRLAENFKFDYNNEKLASIRKHLNNTQNNSIYVFINEINFYKKWFKILGEKHYIYKYWKWNLIKRIIKRLPKIDFIKILLLWNKDETK